MDSLLIYTKMNSLPENLRAELISYMDYLFDKSKKNKDIKHPKAGCLKGIFKMTAGFDEPIEDFKEYMQ
jgi:hypothetical protein